MKTYSAYHNDPVRRQADIDRFEHDVAAERLAQAKTGQEGRGCFIWCTTPGRGYSHRAFASYYDVPIPLPYLLDRLFEGQTPELSRAWARRVLPSIQCGADTQPALDRWLHWLLVWLLEAANHSVATRELIEIVRDLYARRLADVAAYTARPAGHATDAASYSAAYKTMADKLIELLADSPVHA